jgi:hypothetical protein
MTRKLFQHLEDNRIPEQEVVATIRSETIPFGALERGRLNDDTITILEIMTRSFTEVVELAMPR